VGFEQRLRTLRQTKKIVRLISIVLCLEVLVAIGARRDDDPDGRPADGYVKRPLAGFDALDRLALRYLPARSIRVRAAYVQDPLVGVVPIALINTFYLVRVWHVHSRPLCQ
jgi:hypothetical protein